MTSSYKKSGPGGGGAYYIDCMSPDGSKSVDDYYSGSAKEPPGTWYCGPTSDGSRRSNLGIEDGLKFGQVDGREDPERFALLVQGYSPETGAGLVQNAGSPSRIALHDFTLSAPKSISVIWSQASVDVKAGIEAAQNKASRTFLDLMSKMSYSRQGKDGVIKTAAPLRGALFEHGSSREDDPQLHTHCVVLNICERPDGKTGALETLEIMRWQGAATSLYHADLAWNLREMGFEIEKKDNLFEVAGVPDEVREAFSQRRAQILAAVKKELSGKGLDMDAALVSRGLLQKSAIETRSAKGELTREQLEKIWKDRGEALGFTQAEALALMQGAPAPELTEDELLEEARLAVFDLTEKVAVFRDPALLTKVSVQLMGRATPAQIFGAFEAVKADLLVTQSVSKSGLTEDVYTTKEMVLLERDMLRLARRPDSKHVLDTSSTSSEKLSNLDPEQIAAWRAATTDSNSVSIIEGAAGAGKTYTMAAVARTYEAAGYEVTGLSTSWTAALNLKDSADLKDGRAIAGWVLDVQAGKIGLGPKSLLVVDEAGMVGTKDMRSVLKLAKEHGAKVVLLGDTLQQKSISAGDALRVIASQNGTTRLDIIRRQVDLKDREAVSQFFAGQAKDGLAVYQNKGAVHVLEDAKATNDRMVSDWHASRLSNPDESTLMLASSRADALALNQLAHEARKLAGELGESISLRTMDCTKAGQEVEFSVGDDVVFRTNDKEQGVFNRTAGRIEAISIEDGRGRLQIRTDSGLIDVDPEDKKWQTGKDKDKDGALALQHGYCSTTYSSQGLTVDHAFVKDSLSLDRAGAGVAMSRHRKECHVYIDKQVRWEAKMKDAMSDEWHPQGDFSDEECISRMTKSWSSERQKISTLDFDNWMQAGSVVHAELESRADAIEQSTEQARAQIERIRQSSKSSGKVQPQEELLFQMGDAYKLKEPKIDRQALETGIERLRQDGISAEAMREAHTQGFLRFDQKGSALYCGRRADDQALVMTFKDGNMEHDSGSAGLRGRYPAVIKGDPASKDLYVVKTGKEALALWSRQDRRGEPRSSVVATNGHREALSLPHIRQMHTEAAQAGKVHDLSQNETQLVELNRNEEQLASKEEKATQEAQQQREEQRRQQERRR